MVIVPVVAFVVAGIVLFVLVAGAVLRLGDPGVSVALVSRKPGSVDSGFALVGCRLGVGLIGVSVPLSASSRDAVGAARSHSRSAPPAGRSSRGRDTGAAIMIAVMASATVSRTAGFSTARLRMAARTPIGGRPRGGHQRWVRRFARRLRRSELPRVRGARGQPRRRSTPPMGRPNPVWCDSPQARGSANPAMRAAVARSPSCPAASDCATTLCARCREPHQERRRRDRAHPGAWCVAGGVTGGTPWSPCRSGGKSAHSETAMEAIRRF
jgi:hypothetical protein